MNKNFTRSNITILEKRDYLIAFWVHQYYFRHLCICKERKRGNINWCYMFISMRINYSSVLHAFILFQFYKIILLFTFNDLNCANFCKIISLFTCFLPVFLLVNQTNPNCPIIIVGPFIQNWRGNLVLLVLYVLIALFVLLLINYILQFFV